MKKCLLLAIIAILLVFEARGQQNAPRHLFRLYEDNDIINITGNGTDEAYSNGSRLDLYYTRSTPSRSILNRWMPAAGDSSVNVYNWGLTQLMVTPRDITTPEFQTNDHEYAGALFFVHALSSYNPVKKFDYQTELLAGAIGPLSGAAEMQSFIHSLNHNHQPMGWGNQVDNKLLLNFHFTAEKQLTQYRNVVEVIGGGQLFGGTLTTGAAAHGIVRIGKMSPYFKGYLSQFSASRSASHNRFQAYCIVKPRVAYVINHALIKTKQSVTDDTVASQLVENLDISVDVGIVLSYDRLAFSLTQQAMTPTIKGLPSHRVGNISLYYSW